MVTNRKGWLSLARDVPAALEESIRNEPYHFDPGDDDTNILKIPSTLDQMHKLARKLINDRVHFECEEERARRSAERAGEHLKQVQGAIDERLQEIEMRGITKGTRDE